MPWNFSQISARAAFFNCSELNNWSTVLAHRVSGFHPQGEDTYSTTTAAQKAHLHPKLYRDPGGSKR